MPGHVELTQVFCLLRIVAGLRPLARQLLSHMPPARNVRLFGRHAASAGEHRKPTHTTSFVFEILEDGQPCRL
jgi:hypothetical protein